LGLVAQRLANLANAEIQALIEVHEGIGTPDLLADLVAGDNFTAAAHQHLQDFGRLRRQLHEVLVPAELPGPPLELEGGETRDRHRSLIEISSRNHPASMGRAGPRGALYRPYLASARCRTPGNTKQ